VYDLNVCICKSSLEYKSYIKKEKKKVLSFHLVCLFCLHSKTTTFNSNVLGFRVCESFEAFTLWLLLPYCFNFDAITWKKSFKNLWTPKRKAKLGLWTTHWKLYQLSQSFSLPTFSHFLIFSSFTKSLLFFFLMTLLAFFFHLPPKPFCLHSFGDKLWAFNKFYEFFKSCHEWYRSIT
jgi:hypothetical protein